MRRKETGISLGILFWIAAILLVLVIFLFNRRNIERVIQETGLVEVLNQKIGFDSESSSDQNNDTEQIVSTEPKQIEDDGPSIINNQELRSTVREDQEDNSPAFITETQNEIKRSNIPESSAQETESVPDKENPEMSVENTRHAPEEKSSDETQEIIRQERNYLIHLVKIDDDGSISLEAIQRTVSFVSSPLTQTLKNLIEEPKENGNYRNLIPPQTVLNRVWIDSGVAFIDLSEDFRFNPVGLEGYRLQIAQVIATATQFPSVQAVQILIDGQQVDFLGGDGLYIGQPLS